MYDFRYAKAGEFKSATDTMHDEGFVVFDMDTKEAHAVFMIEQEAIDCCEKLNTLEEKGKL